MGEAKLGLLRRLQEPRESKIVMDGGCVLDDPSFSETLRASISEGLNEVLGERCTQALLFNLRWTEPVEDPEKLHRALSNTFGDGAIVLERVIAKKLFRRLDLKYEERRSFEFQKYVLLAEELAGRPEKGNLQ